VTLLCEGDVFRFCPASYRESFTRFAREASEAMEMTRRADSLLPRALREEPPRDDLLYCTLLPWFSFSGMFHPVGPDPMDSVPRIAWGRFEQHEERLDLPLNVQAHHAVIDGIHVGRFFRKVEELIVNADAVIPAG